MITSDSSTFLFRDDAVFISSSVAIRCVCSRAAFVLINRNGSTRCLDCDHFLLVDADVSDDGPSAQGSFEKAIV